MLSLITLLGILCFTNALSERFERLRGNPCMSKESCGQCIQTNASCAWCSEVDFDSAGNQRCDFVDNLVNKCKKPFIVSPENTMLKLTDKPLSDKTAPREVFVQLKPQHVLLHMRPNAPIVFRVQFKAQDYPVDLYYLMDLSTADNKDRLDALAELLTESMRNITSNFRLGFGSFVNPVPTKLSVRCPDCEPTYNFLNHMALSLDTRLFSQRVKEGRISGSLDARDGGLDAILQAIVCKEEIGWRKNSLKILVFASDSGFRSSRNGTQNDVKCQTKGSYMTGIRHFPSPSQINQKIRENNINVIFAVTEDQLPVYEELSEQLEGARTAKLDDNSSGVVALVEDQYKKRTSRVELKDTASVDVNVTYYSTCLDGERKIRNSCEGLKVGTNVTFEARIEVKSCPKHPLGWWQTFEIYPVGISEQLNVSLRLICNCDCEISSDPSEKCNFGGTYECGICNCDQHRYGRNCEGDLNGHESGNSCMKNENDSFVCSGRGQCGPGGCKCHPQQDPNKKIYGQFCECDNFSCKRYNGAPCGGPDHGLCECGICLCTSDWTGESCNCKNSAADCITTNDIYTYGIPPVPRYCSRNGFCECGRCKCSRTKYVRYSGIHCDDVNII